MKKIGFVVQRYGLEVNGGAEFHCRILAENLKDIFDVEVLTTCAKSYKTWANEYSPGEKVINGILVRRFPVAKEREEIKSYKLGRILRKRSLPQKLLRFFGILEVFERLFKPKTDLKFVFDELSKAQGPYTPGLIDHLKVNHEQYDVLIFFTYLYFPTLFGLRVAPHKSILIPTAHDEPDIYMSGFKEVFTSPVAIMFNTPAERTLVHKLFDNASVYNDVVGVGIDTPKIDHGAVQLQEFDFPYFVYIGRVDHAKGCAMMIDYYLKYTAETKKECKLVLVGQQFMEIPASEHVISLGYVSDSRKFTLLRQAQALIMPSYYESLSLVTLESMNEGTPVIVNQHCDVLRKHVEESHSGFLFKDFLTFKTALNAVLNSDKEVRAMKANGKVYVKHNYDWEVVKNKVSRAVDFVIKQNDNQSELTS